MKFGFAVSDFSIARPAYCDVRTRREHLPYIGAGYVDCGGSEPELVASYFTEDAPFAGAPVETHSGVLVMWGCEPCAANPPT